MLDLNLPVLSGLEVCRILRQRPATATVPIIMLTARTSEGDRVTGLDAGADDYVTKPFSLARAGRARARGAAPRRARRRPRRAPRLSRQRTWSADFDAVAIEVDGEPVKLTRREFELLRYLVDNRNRVLSRDRLLERVWGYDRLHRDPLGRRARRAAARQARRGGPADRNRGRPRLPLRRVAAGPSRPTLVGPPFVPQARHLDGEARRARSTRCQSVYTASRTTRLSRAPIPASRWRRAGSVAAEWESFCRVFVKVVMAGSRVWRTLDPAPSAARQM